MILHEKILNWFAKYGRKDLPWQKDKTPYRVWISEIMLQQTQVGTVISYFEKFTKRFSTIFILANAEVDEVMSLWSGLGYYARARNLHKTAKIIAEKCNGIFPDSVDELQRLPGIGRSTAGAILSLSQNIHATILDANVKRVLSRYFLIEENLNSVSADKKLWGIADKLTPKKNTANYNQAMMDIGATVCVRKNPLCIRCPIQTSCKAFFAKKQNDLPIKKKKKILPIKQTKMLIMQNANGEILLEKNPPIGIWGGLWSFPEIDVEQDIKKELKKRFNVSVISEKKLDSFRHTFSHYHLDIFPRVLNVKSLSHEIKETSDLEWFDVDSAKTKGLPKPVRGLIDNGFK